jgi:diguanylate cyclase (GGDEF)-like protein
LESLAVAKGTLAKALANDSISTGAILCGIPFLKVYIILQDNIATTYLIMCYLMGIKMGTGKFKIYSAFSRIPVLRKSYAIKMMAIALFGILMPLFMLIVYLNVNSSFNLNDNPDILIVVLLATLVGMIITCSLIYLIMSPINSMSTGLQQYLNEGKKPKFPTGFRDSVGQLMTHIQYTIEKVDLLSNSLKSFAMRDPLTGIPNRRAGEEHLRQDMARACREKQQMLVALLDINQLTTINERFGYYLGDVCLTQIVETLCQNIREGDWLARWNDDQFLMVLWNFNNANSTDVLERIQQQSVKTTPMGELLHLDLSISACQYNGNEHSYSENDCHLERLLTCINKALSQIKQTGKGGIILVDSYHLP